MLLNIFIDSLIIVIITAIGNRLLKIGIYKTSVIMTIITIPIAILYFLMNKSPENEISAIVMNTILLHLSIGGIFFHFLTLPDRSLTLRILVELKNAPKKKINLEQLDRVYNLKEMIISRLKQLDSAKFIQLDNSKITLRRKGLFLGAFILNGRKVFGISKGN